MRQAGSRHWPPPEYISPCDGSCPNRSHNGYWSPLVDSLMGYGSIVKCHIFLHHVVEMTFIQDEDVIKPFLSSWPYPAFSVCVPPNFTHPEKRLRGRFPSGRDAWIHQSWSETLRDQKALSYWLGGFYFKLSYTAVLISCITRNENPGEKLNQRGV